MHLKMMAHAFWRLGNFKGSCKNFYRGASRGYGPITRAFILDLRVFWALMLSKAFFMGPWYGPLASLKRSAVWAPVLHVVYDGVVTYN